MYSTSGAFRLDRFREHDVEIVIGVLESRKRRSKKAAADTPQVLVDEALKVGHGSLLALDNRGKVTVHSTERACPECGRSFEALDPKMFSYNSSQGWCPKCRGFGELFYLPDVERGARADAIEESWFGWQEGNREKCPECNGTRLNAIARAVRLHLPIAPGKLLKRIGSAEPTIDSFAELPVEKASVLCEGLRFRGREAQIARDILPEIRERLKFLREVGLGYLQLGRAVTTLSCG